MSDWLEELRQRDADAMKRDFWRCVDDEDFPNTEETRKAFIAGWCGTRRYASAKQELNAAGHGSYMFAILAWLFGGMMLFMIGLLYWQGVEMRDNIELVALGCVVLIGCGFLLMKRAMRLGRAAGEKHREMWSDKDG